MSYVVGGKTYDEGGNEIDAYGNKLGGVDTNRGENQAKSATAANMGNGATIEDVNKAAGNTFSTQSGASTSGGSFYGSSIGGSAPQPGPLDPRLGQLYDQMIARSNESLNVDGNSPVIKNQVDAANVAGQRSLLQNEQQAAERGGPYATGALEANARMGAEKLGENLQGITAGAIGNEVTARRQEITQALSGALGVLSLDQQVQLKKEDQALAARQTDLSAQQQQWMQMFQEKGFTADQAAQLWKEMFSQRGQDLSQANTVWDQNWKLSGGA